MPNLEEGSSSSSQKSVDWDKQNLNVADPPPTPEAAKDYFYNYRQSISPHIGIVVDPDSIKDGDIPYLIGFGYMIPRFRSPQVEVGADILSDSRGYLNLGVRRIFYERSYFRPFYKVGFTHEVNPDQRLATFTNFDNYILKFSGGFEDVIKRPMSVRLEIEAALGLKDQYIGLLFGYSWAW